MKLKIVHLKLLVKEYGKDVRCYAVAVEKPRNVGFFNKRAFLKNQIGVGNCYSLIFALTQDSVLEAINQSKKEK